MLDENSSYLNPIKLIVNFKNIVNFIDYAGHHRRRRLGGMRLFMFGSKSQDRAASLPESKILFFLYV